jgi:hypothetical protein
MWGSVAPSLESLVGVALLPEGYVTSAPLLGQCTQNCGRLLVRFRVPLTLRACTGCPNTTLSIARRDFRVSMAPASINEIVK